MKKVIAAVSNKNVLQEAMNSQVETLFYLTPNINTLSDVIQMAHGANKKIYIHIDMAEGLGKDKYGINFAKDIGVDGIISTRANIIKFAKEVGLLTVQRFFVIDSHSIETTIETVKSAKPDMIEILPGIMPKIIERIKCRVPMPVIVGGFIECKEEVEAAIKSGATAVTTSNQELWK